MVDQVECLFIVQLNNPYCSTGCIGSLCPHMWHGKKSVFTGELKKGTKLVGIVNFQDCRSTESKVVLVKILYYF